VLIKKPQNIVVTGAVAVGMSFATRHRRLQQTTTTPFLKMVLINASI
jgi:hypothetical protein